uniref:KTSC domain-containing protein n=1 Tax=Rhizobium phage IG49 TaxID=3129228 RepID=A0AAU8HYW2_9CAUD
MATQFQIPEVHDLVSVTVDHVEYYGYVSSLDLDVRFLTARVEFYPGYERTFDLKDIKLVHFPEPRK